MIQRLSENARDHQMYNEAFHAAARWLADMDERVAACNDTCGDWHSIQERIEDIKVIHFFIFISTFTFTTFSIDSVNHDLFI